jgi:hypothetical protein
MWVWSESSFSTNEARQRLVQFCVEHHINHLDIHVQLTQNNEMPMLKDADAFRDLIILAGQHDITTAALRGNPRMFFSRNHEPALRELQTIIAFSKRCPRAISSKG